jgi:hypothetical protein
LIFLLRKSWNYGSPNEALQPTAPEGAAAELVVRLHFEAEIVMKENHEIYLVIYPASGLNNDIYLFPKSLESALEDIRNFHHPIKGVEIAVPKAKVNPEKLAEFAKSQNFLLTLEEILPRKLLFQHTLKEAAEGLKLGVAATTTFWGTASLVSTDADQAAEYFFNSADLIDAADFFHHIASVADAVAVFSAATMPATLAASVSYRVGKHLWLNWKKYQKINEPMFMFVFVPLPRREVLPSLGVSGKVY